VTDQQYAELLAFAATRSLGGANPVPVVKCLNDADPPRLLDTDPGAPHLGGPQIFVSSRDFNDLNRRVLSESGLTTERK